MIAPAVVTNKLELRRGVDYGQDVTLVAGGGVPVDLTGRTDISASLYAGTPDEPGALAYEISQANGRVTIVSPATAGVVRVMVPGTVTATYTANDYTQWFLVGDDYLPFVRFVSVKPSPLAP